MPKFKVITDPDGKTRTVEAPTDTAQQDLERTRRELKEALHGSGWHVDPNAAPASPETVERQSPSLEYKMHDRIGVLTESAIAEFDDWTRVHRDRGCTCFISPPCDSCTHPGNPRSLEADDTAWVISK